MGMHSLFSSTAFEVLPTDIFLYPSGTTHKVEAITEGTKANGLIFFMRTITIFWLILQDLQTERNTAAKESNGKSFSKNLVGLFSDVRSNKG